MNTLIVISVLTGIAQTASATSMTPATPIVYGAQGPGTALSAFAIGGRAMVLVAGGVAPIPMVTLDGAWAISDHVDFEVHGASVAVFNQVETGARVRILDTSSWAMAFRGEAGGWFGLSRDSGVFGAVLFPTVVPGVLISRIDREAVTWTLGMDVPMIVGKLGVSSVRRHVVAFEHGVMLRPSLTVEVPTASGEGAVHVRLETYAAPNLSAVAPSLSIGYAW